MFESIDHLIFTGFDHMISNKDAYRDMFKSW